MQVYANVQAEGLALDAHFFHHVILIAGRAGDVRRAFAFLDDMRALAIDFAPETAAAAVQAAIDAGDRAAAASVYRRIVHGSDKGLCTPDVDAFATMAQAHAAAGDLPAAVAVVEGARWSRSVVCGCERYCILLCFEISVLQATSILSLHAHLLSGGICSWTARPYATSALRRGISA